MDSWRRPWLTGAGMLLIPAFVFWATLSVPLPDAWQQYLLNYSPLYLALILVITFMLFRAEHYLATLASGVFIAILFALTLTARWQSGYSDAAILAGFIPYKDSYYYYNGARTLLQGLMLQDFTNQAAGRPLFPGLLTSLMPLMSYNLQLILAVLTGFLSLVSYWSARLVRRAWGAAAAALYITLFYFYFQAQIGYLLSELPGLILGTLGFILIWQSVQNKHLGLYLLGLAVLMVGVSVRAGAFFMFPALSLWAGWAFRTERQKYAVRATILALGFSAGMFLLCNSVYPRLVTAPETTTFGNFAYALYGQVRGGAGWSEPLKELGTSEPAAVYRAALEFFQAHPLSFFIGVAKSYRDFFMPGPLSIFSLSSPYTDSGWIAASALLLLLLVGLYRLAKKISDPLQALLLAAFIGLLLSIPFLPPIDGGRRFYASTMPFFFATLAAVLKTSGHASTEAAEEATLNTFALAASSVLLILTLVTPPIIARLSAKPDFTGHSCPAEQIPFAVQVYRGSYVDILDDASAPCQSTRALCYVAFWNNSVERNYDDFFQLLDGQAKQFPAGMRFFTANDLVSGKFHFFIGTPTQLPEKTLVTGCATEFRSRFQTLWKVETSTASPLK